MDIIVYTCSSEIENLEKLKEVFTVTTELTGYCEDYSNKIVIRLGRSNRLPSRRNGRPTDFKNVINPSANIRANCNKKNSSLAMSKIVRVPRIFENEVPNGIETVYRPLLHLPAGQDFSIKRGPFLIEKDFYAVELIRDVKEYRVWRAGNLLKMAERYTPYPERWGKDGRIFNERDFPCRSNHPYVQKSFIPDVLKEQVMKASDLLGLECCACDILKRGNEYYFLEINSCPSVDVGSLALFFKEGILDYIERKFGQVKNDFDGFLNTRIKAV